MKRAVLLILLSFPFIVLSGCEPAGDQTGDIAVRLVWPSPAEWLEKSTHGANARADMPATTATIRIQVSGAGMSSILRDFATSTHRGVIDGIPVGNDRRLTIQALNGAGTLLADCEKTGLVIEAEHTTQAGDCVFKTPKKLGGTLVVPIGSNQAKATTMTRALGGKAAEGACPNVPVGYSPLVNAEVSFIVADGTQLGLADAPADTCGAFTGALPSGTTQVRAVAAGFRDVITDITVFQSGDASKNVASTISDTASYTIGSIQKVDNDTIAFTITDDQSNKAVLGVPNSAFAVMVNSNSASIITTSTAVTTEKASVVMTLDASGSMDATVYTDPASGQQFRRLQLASIAAHTFLDWKNREDEVAAVVFDGTENFIDQAAIDSLFSFTDQNDTVVNHTYPLDGFSDQSKDLRFIVDAYNEYAIWWGMSSSTDALHTDTPNYKQAKSYPWGGTTAFYDSINTSVEKLAARSNLRKYIIAMTDGTDNSSQVNENGAIALAKTNNMAVYTIGFGSGSDETSLQKIAAETGGTYFRAESTDIIAAYQSIQNNITFQYLGDLDTSLGEKFSVEVSLNHNGITVSRELNTF